MKYGALGSAEILEQFTNSEKVKSVAFANHAKHMRKFPDSHMTLRECQIRQGLKVMLQRNKLNLLTIKTLLSTISILFMDYLGHWNEKMLFLQAHSQQNHSEINRIRRMWLHLVDHPNINANAALAFVCLKSVTKTLWQQNMHDDPVE